MALTHGISGFGYALEGLKLVLRPELRRFVIVPFLINLLVFSGLIWLGMHQFAVFMEWILPADAWYGFLRWLLWPLFALTALLLVFYSFTSLANLIAAPFNALLAERVELYLTGQPLPPQPALWKTLLPMLVTELGKLGYFLLRALPLLLLFVIPVLNLAAPVLWFLFNAWMLALQYLDFPMGNHGIGFADQRKGLQRQRLASLGFGSGITLLMMVPGLNFLAMPAAVAGATALWVGRIQPAQSQNS
ncbi:MAG: sulfate transporter CysZ [Gammaproteobacteria bacterium SHHR-1]|uniref:sulfate transporter CysZ n=1 Tax=Magnetovirga frankeli TaxID=947516 RepID=UPI0012931AD2|nr:sulfate transporter CysZ [gamma proteobacterium SS-5]